jgi:hypothetical protein
MRNATANREQHTVIRNREKIRETNRIYARKWRAKKRSQKRLSKAARSARIDPSVDISAVFATPAQQKDQP